MDMTSMIKPEFKQIHRVDLKFALANKEFDEFFVTYQPFAYNELKFEIQCSYYTTYGLIDGKLEFNKTIIQFTADNEIVTQTLLKTTSKQLKDIDQDVLDKFSFTMHLEDIYSVYEKDKWVQFCLFGLTGIDLPILDHENQPSIISVSLLLNHRCSDKVIQIISQLTSSSQISKISSHQIYHLMNYILNLNRYLINKKSFRKILHKYQQHKEFVSMQCLSKVVYYDIISLKKLGGQHKSDIYQQRLHSLNKPSSIISQKHFEQLVKTLPQSVIDNSWCQIFNPKYHGNSYLEFLRRSKNLKEHIVIIKDNYDNIFGAYVEQGWEIQQSYYGSEQSFIFTFKNNGYRVNRASKLNDNYQFCSDEYFIIGGPYEDDQFSIKINNNFQECELNTSSTFRNELLSNENTLLIKEFEIWGVQDNCELMMRHIRLESYLNMDQQ